MSPHKVELTPTINDLSSYGISEHGFLPASPPLERLSHPAYEPWDATIRSLRELLESQTLRACIDALPIIPTTRLISEAEWQRAYSILTMLAQAYIWGGEIPSQRLPPSITIPLLETASHLELSPIASYASLNLWNWRLLPGRTDATLPENIAAMHTLTGTEDESWFYVISNAMEARAGPIIQAYLSIIEAISIRETSTVVDKLLYITTCLTEIGSLLDRMDERCSPQIFFHKIRPFLAGSRNMQETGLPNGVFYDEGEGRGSWRKYRGGSNGQSSLIQFLDIALGIDHSAQSTFHQEMREYMPGPHARFLTDIESRNNTRAYVLKHSHDHDLVSAYDAAVKSLGCFRDKHIQLVTRYILLPSRQHTGRPQAQSNLATMSTKLAGLTRSNLDFVGTGGTKLVPFLKQTRDETLRGMLEGSASRHD